MKIPQDFDRLSAYIDNQLSQAEKAALEARLKREPDLQAALRELRQTVSALRSLPVVKPPRSFTLRPDQVGAIARRGALFPALRLAAALSTLVFALVVAGDFATSGGVANLAASVPQSVTAQSAPTLALAASGAAQPETATPTPETHVQNFAGPAVMTDTATPSAGLTPVPGMAAIQPSATPSGVPERSIAITAGPANKTVAPTQTPTVVPPSVADLATTATQPVSTVAPAPATPAAGGPSPLRLIEVALAAAAVVLGLSAWLARRG
jgi:anti-sigma factor RsiW